MAGQRNKNVFKFLLQLLLLPQKHILGVRKVVCDGLEVVLVVTTDPDRLYHFTKNISFRG